MERLKELFSNEISPLPKVDSSSLRIDRNCILELTIPKGTQKPYVLRTTGSVWAFDSNGDLYPAAHADIIDLARPIIEEEFLKEFEIEREKTINEYKQIIDVLRSENAVLQNDRAKTEEEMRLLSKRFDEKENELMFAQESVEQIPLPNSGIQVVESSTTGDKWTHIIKDLRNDRKLSNRTWDNTTGIHHYAISEHEIYLSTNEVPPNAIESREKPGIWAFANYHANQWKFNFYDFRSKSRRIYYSVIFDSLDGIWRDIAEEYLLRSGGDQYFNRISVE